MPPTTRKDKGAASRPCSDKDDADTSDEESMGSDSGHRMLQIDYKRLASEVARKMMPEIQETLTTTIMTSLQSLQEEITKHDNRIDEAEQRLSTVEDDVATTHTQVESLLAPNRRMAEKIDDLENRSRRNNLRIIGLPERLPASHLRHICEYDIPTALEMEGPCKVERAHRVGPERLDTTSDKPERSTRPRQVIAKFLDYSEKEAMLRAYRKKQIPTKIEGHQILIFGDYSAEVVRKRKAFSKICTSLYLKKWKFQLQYPAILRVTYPDGSSKSFKDHLEAESHLRDLLNGDDRPNKSHAPPTEHPPSTASSTSKGLAGTQSRKSKGLHKQRASHERSPDPD